MSAPGGEGGPPPGVQAGSGQTAAGGQAIQLRERPAGGDEHGASLGRGLFGVLVMLVKISGITLLILLVQKGFGLLMRKPVSRPA